MIKQTSHLFKNLKHTASINAGLEQIHKNNLKIKDIKTEINNTSKEKMNINKEENNTKYKSPFHISYGGIYEGIYEKDSIIYTGNNNDLNINSKK